MTGLNPYYPKRFLSLDSVLKREFGAKVVKIPLNAGFSCPNRDGAKGYGGCIYCSGSLSGEVAGSPRLSFREQFDMGKAQYLNKWGSTLYMAYLQAGTNTYAPYERLVRVFGEALSIPDSVGLSIATRADCVTPRVADLLADISKNDISYGGAGAAILLGRHCRENKPLPHLCRVSCGIPAS